MPGIINSAPDCVTHAVGGVTTRDIALANRIDRILADAS